MAQNSEKSCLPSAKDGNFSRFHDESPLASIDGCQRLGFFSKSGFPGLTQDQVSRKQYQVVCLYFSFADRSKEDCSISIVTCHCVAHTSSTVSQQISYFHYRKAQYVIPCPIRGMKTLIII